MHVYEYLEYLPLTVQQDAHMQRRNSASFIYMLFDVQKTRPEFCTTTLCCLLPFEALNAFFQDADLPLACSANFGSDPPILHRLNMHAIIGHMDQHVTAQLTAGSCLARLCGVEVTRKMKMPDEDVAYSYCKQLLDAGTFLLVVHCLEKAVQMSTHFC